MADPSSSPLTVLNPFIPIIGVLVGAVLGTVGTLLVQVRLESARTLNALRVELAKAHVAAVTKVLAAIHDFIETYDSCESTPGFQGEEHLGEAWKALTALRATPARERLPLGKELFEAGISYTKALDKILGSYAFDPREWGAGTPEATTALERFYSLTPNLDMIPMRLLKKLR